VDLVELYEEKKQEGMQSGSFQAIQQVYEHKIIFLFEWHK
jgi:hypothetical protein